MIIKETLMSFIHGIQILKKNEYFNFTFFLDNANSGSNILRIALHIKNIMYSAKTETY